MRSGHLHGRPKGWQPARPLQRRLPKPPGHRFDLHRIQRPAPGETRIILTPARVPQSHSPTNPDDHLDFVPIHPVHPVNLVQNFLSHLNYLSALHLSANSQSPTVPQTQVIITYSPNTSLTRQRRFEFTDPDDHQPTQMIISDFQNFRVPRLSFSCRSIISPGHSTGGQSKPFNATIPFVSVNSKWTCFPLKTCSGIPHVPHP